MIIRCHAAIIRTAIKFVCILALFPLYTSAQTAIRPEALKLLDSSLALLDMKRYDLAMPWGVPATDRLIMPEVARMFAEPLTAFDRVKFYTDRLKSLNGNNIDDFSYALLPAAGLGNYTPAYYEAAPNTRQINEILKITPDSLVGFIGATTLQRFIMPLIPALNAITRSRSSITSEEILLQLCDSLLLLDKETETANLYELKAGEERSLQQAKDFYSAAAQVDAERLYSAGMSLYRAYLNLIAPGEDALALMRDSIRTIVIQTQYGKIALGGAGDDVYDGDYILILDVGGNDRYYFPNYDKKAAIGHPIRITIDLGGNDIYNGGDFSLGGAIFGTSLLFDIAGNDVYSAGNFSLGCGLFGIGILHDFAGADRYIGKICTQGAAAFGLGILIDDDGNDSYTAESNAQGFGSTRGFGAVCDRAGNDIYAACSPFQDFLRYDAHFVSFTQGAALGSRPVAAGGIGILADFRGNDTYISDIYGQGTAYWFGLGALYDEDGDDRYQAYQYAQGAGVHFGFGTLWDAKGSDSYISHGVSQGCGHDIAMGALLDEDGDDDYNAESLSLGGGNANAVSLFLDLRGNDGYIARNTGNTMGYSDFRRNYGMIGIFADGGGTDQYGETIRNNRIARKSTYGLFYDTEIIATETKQRNEPALTPPDDQKEPLRSTLDSLFIQASAAPQKFQYNVEPARNAIIEQGGAALSFLRTKFGTESPRERLALEIILPKIWDKDSVQISSIILDSLTSENILTFGLCATTAGRKKFMPAAATLISRLNSDDWRICATAAQQLGEIGDISAAQALQQSLTGAEPLVRARAAFSIGQLLPDTALRMLKPAIYDSMQITRNSAIQGLLRNKILPVTILQEAFSEHFTFEARQRLAVLISKVDEADSVAVTATADLVVNQKKVLREYIYSSIIEKRFTVPQQLIALIAVSEKDERLGRLLAGNELPKPPENSEKKSKKKKKKTKEQ
ncbi:MAG: HEAT repeat domain-containing protein [Bacteroidetes bacterium]|nr:HEAT repeat domain-containing protein [Bacteroidota bacterium]